LGGAAPGVPTARLLAAACWSPLAAATLTPACHLLRSTALPGPHDAQFPPLLDASPSPQ
jgi:hypothetical protein